MLQQSLGIKWCISLQEYVKVWYPVPEFINEDGVFAHGADRLMLVERINGRVTQIRESQITFEFSSTGLDGTLGVRSIHFHSDWTKLKPTRGRGVKITRNTEKFTTPLKDDCDFEIKTKSATNIDFKLATSRHPETPLHCRECRNVYNQCTCAGGYF